jgi:protein-disulfide isomerase
MPEKTKILMFVSKQSIYFQTTKEEFQKILLELEKVQPFTSQIIDVNREPELAEKYKVNALPTLIIGSKRFIGKPDLEKIMNVLRSE